MAKLSRIAIGVDIVEIDRVEHAILSWQNSFLGRVYTEAELNYCRERASSLAARFAGKEAVMKALGTSGTKGLSFQDIEILPNVDGAPIVQLHGRAYDKAKEIGVTELSISMSHNKQHAIAFVVCDAV